MTPPLGKSDRYEQREIHVVQDNEVRCRYQTHPTTTILLLPMLDCMYAFGSGFIEMYVGLYCAVSSGRVSDLKGGWSLGDGVGRVCLSAPSGAVIRR